MSNLTPHCLTAADKVADELPPHPRQPSSSGTSWEIPEFFLAPRHSRRAALYWRQKRASPVRISHVLTSYRPENHPIPLISRRTVMFRKTVLALIVALTGFTASAFADQDGAIAYSPSTGRTGWSYNYSDLGVPKTWLSPTAGTRRVYRHLGQQPVLRPGGCRRRQLRLRLRRQPSRGGTDRSVRTAHRAPRPTSRPGSSRAPIATTITITTTTPIKASDRKHLWRGL